MWPKLRLALSLAVWVLGLALLGLFSTAESRRPWWWGVSVGAAVGALAPAVGRADLWSQREPSPTWATARSTFTGA
jgi:hypothetical protein